MMDSNQTISNTETTVSEAIVTNTVAPEAPAVAQNATVQAQQATPDVGAPSLFDSLSDELKQFANLKNFKDVNELAKSYMHAQSLIGKRIQELSPEDIKHINFLKGAPKSHEEYALPAELPNDVVDWYKKTAHDAGLSQEQAKKVVDKYIELNRDFAAKQEEQMKIQTTNWANELKAEIGNAFDNRIQVAKRAVENFGGQELKDILNQTGLGSHPVVVKMFAKIGESLLEDSLIQSDYEKVIGLTPADAKNTLNTKLLDNDFRGALYSATHPAHKAAVAEYERLLSAMHPKG